MFFTVILCLTFCVLYYNKMPYFFIFYTDTLCLTFHALNCYPMPYFLCSLLIHYAVLNCYPMPYFLCSAVIHYALLFMLFTDTLCFIIWFFFTDTLCLYYSLCLTFWCTLCPSHSRPPARWVGPARVQCPVLRSPSGWQVLTDWHWPRTDKGQNSSNKHLKIWYMFNIWLIIFPWILCFLNLLISK